MPRLPHDVEYTTNGDYLFSATKPDVQLLEPPIQCSINRNYLKFSRKLHRPPQSHSIIIVNHGDYPVAFKLICTDNNAYFTSQKTGVIPGRRLNAFPHIRMSNATQIVIYRRPLDAVKETDVSYYYTCPKKDRLFILLTPAHSHSIAPAAYFNPTTSYMKLRVCLEYTAVDYDEDNKVVEPEKNEKKEKKDKKAVNNAAENQKKRPCKTLIYRKAKGWCTWDTSDQQFTDLPPVPVDKPAVVAPKEGDQQKAVVKKQQAAPSKKTEKKVKPAKPQKVEEDEDDESKEEESTTKNAASKKGVSAKKPKGGASKKGKSSKKVAASKKAISAKKVDGSKKGKSQKGASAKNSKKNASKKNASKKGTSAKGASKKANKSAKNQKPIAPKSAELVGAKPKVPVVTNKGSAEGPKTVDATKGPSKMVKPMSKEPVPSKTVMPLAPGAQAQGPVSFFAQPKK